jgi:hypothetical protein
MIGVTALFIHLAFILVTAPHGWAAYYQMAFPQIKRTFNDGDFWRWP